MSKLDYLVKRLAHEINKLEIIETYSNETTADKVQEVRENLSILSVEISNLADEFEWFKKG